MVTRTLTLNSFSQSVPVCESTADLETVLETLQSGQHELLVVIDRHRCPLGAIYCRSLLSHLVERWHRVWEPQIEAPSINLRSLMLPLATLGAQMEIQDFLSLLSEGQPLASITTCALVDEQGRFVGLLNSWSLFKSLLASQERASLDDEWPPTCLSKRLQEFIEQFPLPIMLHSEQNQIIYQNQQWRGQIGESIAMGKMNVSPLNLKAGTSSTSPLSHYWWNSLPDPLSKIQAECLKESESLVAQVMSTTSVSLRDSVLKEAIVQVAESASVPTSEVGSGTSDRIWQFNKIPLHFSQEWAELSPELTNPSSESQPHWLVIATDITQQQQCSQELAVKNADLVYLNRLKDEFLACISHELKSPLTAVVGLSSLLKEQKIGELNSRQAHYAELIYKSGRQLMTLVNDLLDLTRLETGQLKLNPSVVKIKRACQRAYELVRDKHQAKTDEQILFHLEIEPGLEQLVIDELRLQQMLTHLLDNAIKFTPEGGEIGIRVNRWENWIAFTIWDTGIGIPEGSQHLIFQKFQQLESPLTRQFEGTGLGLVLTQRLAKAHGGDISFISKVGQGSQFTLLLPPHPLPQADGIQASSWGDRPYPIVLMIESDPHLINEITGQLTDLGYRVVIARTGTEALEKARQLRPHRIFLNPLLPLLSGWDVLTLLKSDPRTSQIRVVVTAAPEHQIYSEQKGADSFVSLPVEKKALQEVLERLAFKTASLLKNITILRLYPHAKPTNDDSSNEQSALDLLFSNQFSQFNYRLLEADSLEQAEIMANVWKVNVVILDDLGVEDPMDSLIALSQCECLRAIPLITLDATVTAAANQLSGLSVFPCLIPKSENQVEQLLQVIQIAIDP